MTERSQDVNNCSTNENGPSAQALFEHLQPDMVSGWQPQTGPREWRWFQIANERLLGHPARNGHEATGLEKYGDNHLRPAETSGQGGHFLLETSRELVDAITQSQVIWRVRMRLGLEPGGAVRERLVAAAGGMMKHALKLIEQAEEVKE